LYGAVIFFPGVFSQRFGTDGGVQILPLLVFKVVGQRYRIRYQFAYFRRYVTIAILRFIGKFSRRTFPLLRCSRLGVVLLRHGFERVGGAVGSRLGGVCQGLLEGEAGTGGDLVQDLAQPYTSNSLCISLLTDKLVGFSGFSAVLADLKLPVSRCDITFNNMFSAAESSGLF